MNSIKKVSILVLLWVMVAALPIRADITPRFYSVPSGGEWHLACADGVLYLMCRQDAPQAEGGWFYDVYAYDPMEESGFSLVMEGGIHDEVEYPFVWQGGVYTIQRGERVMRIKQAPAGQTLPDEVEIIPMDLFPASQTGSKWDEPSHFLLSIAKADSLVYLVTEEPEDVRSLCYINLADLQVKAHKVGQSLFGFSQLDAHHTLYYASDDKSTDAHFHQIKQLNWQTKEVVHRGDLPITAWGIAYDAQTDHMLYFDKGVLYRQDWHGNRMALSPELTKRRVDQRGFILPDRSLVVNTFGGGEPDSLMVIQLPDQ